MSRPTVPIFRDKSDLVALPKIPESMHASFVAMGNRLNGGGLSYFDKLRAVYEFMDLYGAWVASFAVCTRGCSHCCRMDVRVGSLEAHYIQENAPVKVDGLGWSVTAGHRTACPFLGSDNTCTVYEFRPFNCRTFHTLDDPKYCEDGDESHQVYGSAGAGYGVGFYSTLAAWLERIEETHEGRFRDIRDWFPG